MRVITGEARGRRLKELSGMDTRPTTDKVKESMFNIVQFDIEGRKVLDLFAGTGQLGIEALSRGAAEAVFVDKRADAVKLVRDGQADAVMKGIVDTSIILKAVLDKEIGLRDAPVLSHVALFQVPGYDRLLYVTDAAMNIAPDLEAKKHIVSNAVKVAHALGNPNPIVACLCAVEKVNPKMPATLDAAALVEANAAGALPGCTVIGPLALDNAVSPEAARHKGITDPNAGHADILLVPNIETGNVFYKSMVFMAKSQNAGLLLPLVHLIDENGNEKRPPTFLADGR